MYFSKFPNEILELSINSILKKLIFYIYLKFSEELKNTI